MNNQNQLALQPDDIVKFEVGGKELELSPNAVSQFITKGNGDITLDEAVNFIYLCKYAELNPFLNEAYLVKFGNQPAQIITGKEAFMKRANRRPEFNGFKAGIVVMRDNEVIEKEGQTLYPNEQLLAGWARVYRKDLDHPFFVEASLSEFSKGQATWRNMPANMIRKVALVNALREAFPEDLGAMYTEEDIQDQAGGQPKQVVAARAERDKAQSLEDKFNQAQKEPESPQPESVAEDHNVIDGDYIEVNEQESDEHIDSLFDYLEEQGVDVDDSVKAKVESE